MTESELRIGNYVQLNGYEPIFCIFALALDRALIYHKDTMAGDIMQASVGELNPVLLTTEKMVALGFTKETDRWHHPYEPTWIITLTDADGIQIWSLMDKKSNQFMYVHELQNAFYADIRKDLSLDFFSGALRFNTQYL